MRCPKCASLDIKVNEKRDLEADGSIRRRRECQKCGFRFTTYERAEIPSLLIIKKNGTREPYAREKLASGIKKAFQKRPFSEEQIEGLIDEIERNINTCACTEMKSSDIGNMVIVKLKETDEVAYLRFASVYKSFESAQSFKKEAEQLI
jgi:transcriptional repressor NrdR